MPLPNYIDARERELAELVVRRALDRNWTIAVFDGEQFTTREPLVGIDHVTAQMGHTETDSLHFYRGESRLGFVQLIWGNGEDLISDCSSSGLIENFVDELLEELHLV